MDLNNIMRNIYGENATQSFDSLHISGGSAIHYEAANIKYLDEPDIDTSTSTTSEPIRDFDTTPDMSFKANSIFSELNSKFDSMSGGSFSSLSGGAKSEVYPSAEYVNDADLKLFIDTFYLHYLVSNIHKNTILIIPSSATLKKLIDEFKSKLKSEGIEPISPEASRFASKNELPYKNYIFDVYGRDSPNNENFPYQIPTDFPASGSKDVFRRTNRLGKVYFFKFESESKISISAAENMKDSTTLKFVAKCDNECFILKGDVPASSSGKKSNVVTAAMSGGNAKSRNSYLRRRFLKLVEKYGDIEDAAYDFIGSIGAVGDISANAKKLSKYYSGDYVNTAFSILADKDGQFDFDEDADDDTINEVHSRIIDNYLPKASTVKMDKVQDALSYVYKRSKRMKNGLDATKTFISTLHKMYDTIQAPKYMIKSDVATALCKKNRGIDSVINAFNVMDEIDNNESDASTNVNYFNTAISSFGKSSETPLMSAMYNAMASSPFVGEMSREYTPLLLHSSHKKSRASSFRPKSAFEDNEAISESDNALQFSILNDDEGGDGNSGKSTDSSNSGSDDTTGNDSSEFDIKSFF